MRKALQNRIEKASATRHEWRNAERRIRGVDSERRKIPNTAAEKHRRDEKDTALLHTVFSITPGAPWWTGPGPAGFIRVALVEMLCRLNQSTSSRFLRIDVNNDMVMSETAIQMKRIPKLRPTTNNNISR